MYAASPPDISDPPSPHEMMELSGFLKDQRYFGGDYTGDHVVKALFTSHTKKWEYVPLEGVGKQEYKIFRRALIAARDM